VRKISSSYVEVMRNVPLLLQLFVWYAFFTELLPGVRQAINVGGLVFLSQRGLRFAWPVGIPRMSMPVSRSSSASLPSPSTGRTSDGGRRRRAFSCRSPGLPLRCCWDCR
jgi:hypothetical protein